MYDIVISQVSNILQGTEAKAVAASELLSVGKEVCSCPVDIQSSRASDGYKMSRAALTVFDEAISTDFLLFFFYFKLLTCNSARLTKRRFKVRKNGDMFSRCDREHVGIVEDLTYKW